MKKTFLATAALMTALGGPALAAEEFRESALYDGAHPHILRPKRTIPKAG